MRAVTTHHKYHLNTTQRYMAVQEVGQRWQVVEAFGGTCSGQHDTAPDRRAVQSVWPRSGDRLC